MLTLLFIRFYHGTEW